MKSLMALTLFMHCSALWANQPWTYERLVALFSPGESIYYLPDFRTNLKSRTCHNVTGCTTWSEEARAPDLVFENDSLWRCTRCTSTRYSSANDRTLKFPLDQTVGQLYFYGNQLHLGFFASEEPYKLRFSAEWDEEATSFSSARVSTSAFYSMHDPVQCYPVGRDRECKVGNYYHNGRISVGKAVFASASRITLAEEEFEIVFEARSRPDHQGVYREHVWTLHLPAP